jgi:hypothetical protein
MSKRPDGKPALGKARARPKRRFLWGGIKAPSYATWSLQLTSRIFGNMMADNIVNGSVITQTSRAAIPFSYLRLWSWLEGGEPGR